MTDLPSQIEWYLARDGQQHGPLSENEMRAFVDLGHLRPTDLIWRAGFADWRPAPEVFAIHAAPVPMPAAVEPAAPDASIASAPAKAAQAASTATLSRHEPAPAADPVGVDQFARAFETTSTAAAPEPADHAPLLSPDQLLGTISAAVTQPTAEHYASNTPTNQRTEPRAAEPARTADPTVEAAPARRPSSPNQPQAQAPQAKRPQAAPAQPMRIAKPAAYDADDADDELAPKRRIGGAAIAAMLVVAVAIGGGITAFLKRDMLTSLLPEGGVKAVVASVQTTRAAPFVANGSAPESIDQSFQRIAIWQHIKQEFPEWYAERVQEAAKLANEKRGEGAIARHLAEAMVALRRKHADQALTAGPERLRFVATSFLDNLQALSKQNVDTCYGFISQGETFPAVLDMLQQPDGNAMLQKQVVAVFEAIAEGRKAPKSYLPPRKSDYDALASELNARGWTENDLRTFSDPRALGRASPQQVCRMVQDWFAAQIAIKDPDAQLRLLVESLRPVVAG